MAEKMHSLLSGMSVVYVLTTPILEDDSLDGQCMADDESSKEVPLYLGRFTQHKMNMDKAIQEELTHVELGSHLRIEKSLRVQDSDKPKGNNVTGPTVVNMCEKLGHLKKDCKGGKVGNKDNGSVNGSSNSLKDQNMFNKSFQVYYVTYVSKSYFVKDDDVAWLNIVNDNIGSTFMSISKLNDSILWHARLGHVHYKRMQDMCKDGLIPAFDIDTEKTESRVLGYAEHSKAFRFYVIEPNESVLINSIIESRDAIFDENRFSSVPRPSQRSLINGTKDISSARDEVSDQHSYCFNVEDDPKTFDEAMKSQNIALWKEAINDEIDSIMGNNTWVLADLPPSCKPLGYKWIFKMQLKVYETVEKFKARLVIQGFKQKSGIDYFDTYALVARISTIRLFIALASIHNLIIHQMDVKIAFLNGELDEEVYMNQPQGFIMLGNENKMCKVIKSLYGLKQAPKQWHQKFNEVVLSSGYLLNQADKCVYSKFDESIIWIINTEDNSSTSSWVILLSRGAISWASKKQTCITSSIMEYEFVALAAASREAEWLRNLILETPLWSKPIAPISIRCDSAATWNYTKLGRIVGNLVQLWVQFISGNGTGGPMLYDWIRIVIKNFLKNGKLDQVVVIVKSCTLNVLGDLTVTLKDLLVPRSGSGVGGSGMLNEEEIMKLLEEKEEMVDLELQVCGNVNAEEDQYKLDEEALNLTLEEEAKAARVEHEWLEKSKVEAACVLEVEAVGALDLVEVEVVRAFDLVEGAMDLVKVEETYLVGTLDLVGLSLNIIISASVSGYLTSLNKTRSSSLKTSSSLDT
ncbi:zinc finger, CCHC-type containing protein [Tanacetum coccineum]